MLSEGQINNRLATVGKVLNAGVLRTDTSYNLGLSDAYQAVLELDKDEAEELIKKGVQWET